MREKIEGLCLSASLPPSLAPTPDTHSFQSNRRFDSHSPAHTNCRTVTNAQALSHTLSHCLAQRSCGSNRRSVPHSQHTQTVSQSQGRAHTDSLTQCLAQRSSGSNRRSCARHSSTSSLWMLARAVMCIGVLSVRPSVRPTNTHGHTQPLTYATETLRLHPHHPCSFSHFPSASGSCGAGAYGQHGQGNTNDIVGKPRLVEGAERGVVQVLQ